jgi:ABC-type Mn2+/Zn2+ transport system ATPase subunit
MAYSFLNLLILIAIIVSGYQVIQGQMTFGTLVAIQLYVSGIWTPAEYLLDTYKGYISTKAIINDFAVMLETDQISYSLSTIESISVENLTLIGENGQHVISNLNFVFDNQNLNLITGPNGSGKTFLVHAILGMTQHYEGNISYSNFGFNNNISYIPGEPESSQYLNDSLPQTASFGQRKLSQIQRYLGEEKEVYIFDEPTNYLDLQHRKFVYEIIQDLVERGKIVVVISHDEEFKKFANVRILELEH